MKRHGGLWPTLVSFRHLLRSAERAAKGKRCWPNVARFWLNLEKHLCTLEDELRQKKYQPGPYRSFLIHDPKERLISAAPFRDRVVHHALTGILEPIFERCFVFDNYACRKQKGTHAAVNRFSHYARRYKYVFQGDIRKYFPSMDHQILKELVRRKIKDRDVLWLVDRIIDHSNEQEQVWFPGEDLFAPWIRRRGLPLGNQTSQFFANVYLNPFDHFVKEVLRAPGYMRYVDDFTLFHDDPVWLGQARERCGEFLGNYRLLLHPRKSVISRAEDGNRFLGYRMFVGHRLLPKKNVRKFRQRLACLQRAYADWRIDWKTIQRSVAGWVGHARQADSWQLVDRLLADTTFSRGK